MEVVLRICLDATPLLGPRTGIGRYVASLLEALTETQSATAPSPATGHSVSATAFTLRGRSALPAALPAGVRAVGPPVPARLMQQVWRMLSAPSITSLVGRVDVFHGTNFVLPPPGRAAGVVTVHDLSYLRTPGTVTAASRAYRELVPVSVRRAAMVLTPSRAVADEVIETYHLAADRVMVTPLGVSEEWFATPPPDADQRRQLSLPERYFLFVGSLEPRKNLPVLLEAYRLLLRRDPDAPPLVLLGPPGWGPALRTAGIPEDKLLFTGYRAEADLRATVAGAEALVYPSAYEGFGLPPLEAFACGVPVIASDLAVVEEVVGTDRELAARVPVGDVEALAEALACRLSRPDATGAAAARRARARQFTWRETAEVTLRAYRHAAG